MNKESQILESLVRPNRGVRLMASAVRRVVLSEEAAKAKAEVKPRQQRLGL